MIESLYPGAFDATLENGMRVLVEEVPSSRSAAVGIWIRAGSRDDPPDAAGIAHFIEHLAFKGTVRRDATAISRDIDSIGGHLNAATGKESTFYYADVPADGLPVAVDLLADLVFHPRFDDSLLCLERNVVLEEIRGHLDDPEQSAYDLFATGLWRDRHPLSRPVLGTHEAIASLTRRQVTEHHRRTYHPSNAVLVVCGAVEHRRLLDQAEQLVDGTPSPAESIGARQRGIVHPGRSHHERPTGQTHVYYGWPGPDASNDDRFPLEVVNSILGDGPSSRLFRAIREDRGLAYAVSSNLTCYSDAGVWMTYAGVAPHNVSRVIDLISSELERLRDESLPVEEVELAKSKLHGHLVLGLETNGNRAARLGAAAVHHREILSPDDLLVRLERVDREEGQAVIERYLRLEGMNLTTVGPGD